MIKSKFCKLIQDYFTFTVLSK